MARSSDAQSDTSREERRAAGEPLRIGVVGAGAIAQLAHLPVLSKMRGVQLVALCDNDRPKARALADRFDIPDAYTDIEDLLEADGLEAVVVATPNHLHEPHVLSALAAGMDVLCERPIALTARGTERIINACSGLAPAQLNAPCLGTYGSILDTLRHTVESDRSYVKRFSVGEHLTPIEREIVYVDTIAHRGEVA